jgi:SAM-dependent methyltransferase
MRTSDNAIEPHHQAAARLWGLGGEHYDEVSFAISDALGHAAQRLAPRPGEKVLDVATGTGWTARTLARLGSEVTGVDISNELLSAARRIAGSGPGLPRFELADAERLPYADASFDKVISTFGVMFAANQEKAARELARVCKPGGRLVLAAWVPGGSVERFFGVIAAHAGGEPPAQSPLNWGDPESLQSLLGDDFELLFESGWNHAYHEGLDHIWEWYARGFGPVRAVIEGLVDDEAAGAFRRDVDEYHRPYLTEAGLLHVKREYLVTIATRKA